MVLVSLDTYKTKLWLKRLFDKQKRVGSNPVSPTKQTLNGGVVKFLIIVSADTYKNITIIRYTHKIWVLSFGGSIPPSATIYSHLQNHFFVGSIPTLPCKGDSLSGIAIDL